MKEQRGIIKVGCCGLPVSLEKYAKYFNLVEIQSTFYKLPMLETAHRWRTKVPEDFEFTMKAWQGITHLTSSPTYRRAFSKLPGGNSKNYGHFQPTDEVFKAWEDSYTTAKILKAKVVVIQCPPNFKQSEQNIKNITNFFKNINRRGITIALELRADWEQDFIKSLCKKFNLVHCVDPFKEKPLAGKFRYYRLHGSPPGKQMYRYTYQKNDLDQLKEVIKQDITEDRDTYCLFNNDTMLSDAQNFIKLLKNI